MIKFGISLILLKNDVINVVIVFNPFYEHSMALVCLISKMFSGKYRFYINFFVN